MRLAIVLLLMLVIAGAARGEFNPGEVMVEKVATGFTFVEGPALGPDGAIYFSDIPSRKVHRHDPQTGETTIFLEDSGGSNGLAFDAQGRLVLCEDRDRRLSRHSGGADDARVLLADRFDGRRFNSPNDLVIDGAGNIYFTDPRYGKQDDRELDVEAVYFVTLTGEVEQIITDLMKPNGIMLSPDSGRLYVADSRASRVMVYDVIGPGAIGNGRVFGAVDGKGGPDGMAVDAAGNLYVAWHGGGGIHVWNPAGEKIGFLPVPEQPSNLTFGPGGGTLYITAAKSLYRVTSFD